MGGDAGQRARQTPEGNLLRRALRRRFLGPGPQHPLDLGDVGVKPRPRGFQTLEGGGEDFGSESRHS